MVDIPVYWSSRGAFEMIIMCIELYGGDGGGCPCWHSEGVGGGYYRICGRLLMLEIGSREKEDLLNICIYIM